MTHTIALILLSLSTACNSLILTKDYCRNHDLDFKHHTINLVNINNFRHALENNDFATITLYLQQGGNINVEFPDQSNPLGLAAYWGDLTLVQYLCFHGADINQQDGSNRTALMLAATENHQAVVQDLLNRGAQIFLNDIDNEHPILAAYMKGHRSIAYGFIDFLIARIPSGEKELAALQAPQNEDQETLLMLAAQVGYQAKVQYLLDKEVDVNQQDEAGRTALMLAAIEGHEDIVQSLLDMHAKPNLQDEEGNTAMHLAAMDNREKIIKILLEHGADPSIENDFGDTAFDCTDDEKIKALLEEYSLEEAPKKRPKLA